MQRLGLSWKILFCHPMALNTNQENRFSILSKIRDKGLTVIYAVIPECNPTQEIPTLRRGRTTPITLTDPKIRLSRTTTIHLVIAPVHRANYGHFNKTSIYHHAG